MNTANIKNKLLKLVPKNTQGAQETTELRKLIVELLRPKLAKLRQILGVRLVPATRDYYNDDAEDWWPDYQVSSDCHAISDINGLLILTQDVLKGMPDDFKSIGKKMEYAYLAAKPDNLRTKDKRYCLLKDLIKDMMNFLTNFSRLCTRILEERRGLHDLAATTLDTSDRIKVKIFDERTFVQLQSRIASLRNYIRHFCTLFEARVETKREAAIGPQDKLGEL